MGCGSAGAGAGAGHDARVGDALAVWPDAPTAPKLCRLPGERPNLTKPVTALLPYVPICAKQIWMEKSRRRQESVEYGIPL